MNGKSHLIDCEVGPKTQAELRQRLAELEASLAHRNPDLLRLSLKKLFALCKLSAAENPDDLADVYMSHLSRLPAWAIVRACQHILEGKGVSETFSPSAIEIWRKAETILADVYREQAKIEAILTALPDANTMQELPASEAERRTAKVREAIAKIGRAA